MLDAHFLSRVRTLLRGAAPGTLDHRDIIPRPYIDRLSLGKHGGIVPDIEGLPADNSVDLSQHLREGILDVKQLEGGGLHEEGGLTLSKGPGVLGGDGPEVAQVGFVPDEHDHDVVLGVVPQLLEPPPGVLELDVTGSVVDHQCPPGSSVVCACDGSVSVWWKKQKCKVRPHGKLHLKRTITISIEELNAFRPLKVHNCMSQFLKLQKTQNFLVLKTSFWPPVFYYSVILLVKLEYEGQKEGKYVFLLFG